MRLGQITGYTRVLGEEQGYIPLYIRDEVITEAVEGEGTPVMHSAWKPGPDELARLNGGGAVVLSVIGKAHPPVFLNVSLEDTDAQVPPSADQIVCEEWQRIVTEFDLPPGSHTEKLVSRILNRLRNVDNAT